MKRIRRAFLLLTILLLAFSLNVSAAGLNKTQASLFTGKSVTLKLSGVKGKVTWKSSNKKVAKVTKKGKVTGKGAGTCVISAKVKKGKTYKCSVYVSKPYLSRTELTIAPGQRTSLQMNGTDAKSWKSSNKAVATVSNKGVIEAKKEGTVTITCKGKNKKSYKCKVIVSSKVTMSIGTPGEVQGRPLQILFVGNSKTYVGDIPGQFAGLCKAAGQSVNVYSVTAGASSLQQLAEAKGAEMTTRPYDYVILQEQTTVGNFGTVDAVFTKGAKAVAALVRKVNPKVKLIVRESWAYSTDEEQVQQWRRDAASSVALQIGGNVAMDNAPMYGAQSRGYVVFGDTVHQNDLGAYLSACCVYKTIYGSPVGNTYTGRAGANASVMQQIAAQGK